MANPPGTQANRWNQAVNATAATLSISTAAADVWLNEAWSKRLQPQTVTDQVAMEKFIKWAEVNAPTAPTLNLAFVGFVT